MEILTTSLPYAGVMSSQIGGRQENQDTCGYAETARGLILVVCDGMGGGPAGKRASMMATSAIIDYVKNWPTQVKEVNGKNDISSASITDSKILENAIKEANREMRNTILQNPSLEGMGTTVAVILINKDRATIAHVGDSRIYQIRDKKAIFRTSDHSRVGEMVRMGSLSEEQARLSAYSNIITRALGVDEDVDVEIDVRPYEKGDRFVICTDGIWGAKPETEMVKLFVNNPKSLQGTMDVLNLEVEKEGKLNKGGKHDNYSAIILEVNINSILEEKMSKKVKNLIYGLAILCGASIILNILFIIMIHGYRSDLNKLKENLESIPQTENITISQELTVDSPDIKNTSEVSTPSPVPSSNPVTAGPSEATINTTQETKKNNVSEESEKKVVAISDKPQKDIKEIISKVNELGDMLIGNSDANIIQQKREEIIKDLRDIKSDYSQENQSIIDEAIKELSKPKTIREGEEGLGQCKAIVGILKKIN